LHQKKIQLLDMIDEADSTETTENIGKQYLPTSETTWEEHTFSRSKTTISKLDWFRSRDFNGRPWVNFVKDIIGGKLNTMVYRYYGLSGIKMHDLWFQQYVTGDTHGWHIHSQNFTGVYYLELPEEDNKTKLLSGQKLITPKVKEGDICLFPAFTIHEAPKITSTKRKTIISYNFDIMGISSEKYNIIKYK